MSGVRMLLHLSRDWWKFIQIHQILNYGFWLCFFPNHAAFTCGSNEFQCIDNSCIPQWYACDFYWDCQSGEDEEDCQAVDGKIHGLCCIEDRGGWGGGGCHWHTSVSVWPTGVHPHLKGHDENSVLQMWHWKKVLVSSLTLQHAYLPSEPQVNHETVYALLLDVSSSVRNLCQIVTALFVDRFIPFKV